ncbi:hypothetical protein [Draconibacterium mangrovi]|uniref:hypothetical protein n=1 Tax=Draconibacterium mangrovi TaxID=2697469 RepID=UPI0013D2B481|nr:hypothetical protein [Draconibacterium mangrovi]
MKAFIVKLTTITIAIAVIGWLVFSLAFPEYYLPVLPFLLLFFYLATMGIYAYQLKMAKKDIGKFTRSNMLITFFKLVLYSVVAVVYIAIDNENAIPFVICLMLLYLIFTFFEVTEITRITKSTAKK